MRELERFFKALANRRRLAIIRYLGQNKQAAVGDIAAHLRLSFSATSRHLSLLASVGLVENEQRGLQVYYSLSGAQQRLLSALKSIF